MKRLLGVVLLTALGLNTSGTARGADEKDATAVLDTAIRALGGAEKLGGVKAATWKTKGTVTIGGSDNAFDMITTVQGLDNYRSEFEAEFGGNSVKGVTVLNGDKGWRKFGDMGDELDKDALANEKRNVYLQVVPATLLPLKGKGFKVEAAGTEKVDGKPATVLKVTGPDGKDFKLFFDQESGLPVKQVAKVIGFMGDEFTQETTFSGYKEFNGVKRATKIQSKRDGEKFIEQEVRDFKVVEKVDPKTFSEPK
ncbi:LolA-like protein [Frigoriglobus tundricola]|uniref:Outer membrane lipoprotein-sorting protein n=1 Tax=Frigoriglobus tundricola TaxID=2774151 RepID=A0A6M5Z3J1_9BACT|nr:hypothetical protein [Frigoriglobus tundricola]QJX00990.1 hypothetical protein FTUN_8628 [Frigoriglobus tundricola]